MDAQKFNEWYESVRPKGVPRFTPEEKAAYDEEFEQEHYDDIVRVDITTFKIIADMWREAAEQTDDKDSEDYKKTITDLTFVKETVGKIGRRLHADEVRAAIKPLRELFQEYGKYEYNENCGNETTGAKPFDDGFIRRFDVAIPQYLQRHNQP